MAIKRILRYIWVTFICASILLVLFVPISKHSQAPSIVTTFFPVYDITRNLLIGTGADIKMLIPPGTEIHDYDPTPHDISSLQNAKIIIYNGGESEAWLEKILTSINTDATIIRLMDYVETITHDADEYDEHIWLSPKNNIAIIDVLSKNLSSHLQNPTIKVNAENYKRQFQKLDQDFSNLANQNQNQPIVIADHFPFAYFIRDYTFPYIAAYNGCSHEAEPSSSQVSELIKTVKSHHISTIFTTEFSNQNIAKTVTEPTNANIQTLYSAETVTATDLENGITLLELQQRNYNTLRDYYDAAN